MSWRTRLLPYLEQEALWRATVEAYTQDRYVLEDPPHWVRHETVAAFLCPADGPRPESPIPHSVRPYGLSSFLGVEGVTAKSNSGMFFVDSATRFADATDGTSNTLLVGERPPHRYGARGRWYGGWGYWGNTDSTLGVRESFVSGDLNCPPGPYAFQRGRVEDDCSLYHFWSLHAGGANFLFADGAVRFLPYSAAEILTALATRDGGEVQGAP